MGFLSESKCGKRRPKRLFRKDIKVFRWQLINYILDIKKERSVMIQDKDMILTTSSSAVEKNYDVTCLFVMT